MDKSLNAFLNSHKNKLRINKISTNDSGRDPSKVQTLSPLEKTVIWLTNLNTDVDEINKAVILIKFRYKPNLDRNNNATILDLH